MDPKSVENPTFGDPTNLNVEKLQELETVLKSILALPLAKDTYAQILDGSPIRTPFSDDIRAHKSSLLETIIVGDKTKPSDDALQGYESIRRAFTPQILRIDLKLAQHYQNAPPGSREHRLRLLEIVAASLNALAGIIFASSHPNTQIKPPTPREGHFWQFRQTDHFYVDFYHTGYQLLDHYPFGLLNVVGYWAEAELLGGVVLFERGESGSEMTNAFIHRQRASSAFQLSENQLKSFANLGSRGDAPNPTSAETILPFAKEQDARTESIISVLGRPPVRIYKNDYDKQPVTVAPRTQGCVIKRGDPRFPSMENMMKVVVENELNRAPTNPQTIARSEPSLQNTSSPADDAASSSKDDTPQVSKKDH